MSTDLANCAVVYTARPLTPSKDMQSVLLTIQLRYTPGIHLSRITALSCTSSATPQRFTLCPIKTVTNVLQLPVPATFTSAPTHAQSLRYYWGRQLWLMSHLWKRWVEEYLVTFTTREKWTKIRLQSENGNLEFLVEEGVTGGSWGRSWRRCRGVTVSPGLVSGDHLVASWSRISPGNRQDFIVLSRVSSNNL
ncbi:hypothetical protein T07_13114 [Trichinella nelsoni]|uniref:DUF5641 domain-containing protein n=1 Tax=Trichinella nelsoni TaxID=6336 RepID=A0A0V0SIB1_9BILA|nr:hypothetical protein T07_13114 [Trichinella nelsoni]